MYLLVSNSLPTPIAFYGNLFLTELMAGRESAVCIMRVCFTPSYVYDALVKQYMHYGMLFAYRRCTT